MARLGQGAGQGAQAIGRRGPRHPHHRHPAAARRTCQREDRGLQGYLPSGFSMAAALSHMDFCSFWKASAPPPTP